ncbi:MAG TPA: isoaspartyl peptidase/L-asparaginase [Solimonas sp.]|nr:isoaspartyl peptidase/L-asparaginase [Solimonas sp.]
MIRLAIHGGAGDAAPGTDHSAFRAALRRIAAETLARLAGGSSALDAVEHAVALLEECPLFNAGVGAVLNRDGVAELDAAIMDGRDRRCGAVAGVTRARSPVRLARAVMEKSPHVMFSGAGADQINRELGLPEVTPDHFVTELRFRQLKEAHRTGAIVLDHDSAFSGGGDGGFGTVGAVARDAGGNLAAATSTGGLTNKHPGRIGDTPIIGAGTWADDASLAVSCTGTGECFIRGAFAHTLHARQLYCGWDLDRACAEGLEDVRRLNGRGGCIAVDRHGALALPFNSRVMYRAWVGADGVVHVGVEPGEQG